MSRHRKACHYDSGIDVYEYRGSGYGFGVGMEFGYDVWDVELPGEDGSRVDGIFCATGNGGTGSASTCHDVGTGRGTVSVGPGTEAGVGVFSGLGGRLRLLDWSGWFD